jgi:hypothetical protein
VTEFRNFLRDGRVFLIRFTGAMLFSFCLGVYYLTFEPEFYLNSRQSILIPYLTWFLPPLWVLSVAWSFAIYRRNSKDKDRGE